MHISEYGTYDALISTIVKTACGGVLILSVHHESEEEEKIGFPQVQIKSEILTPEKWGSVVEKSKLFIIEEGRLEEIYEELVKLDIRFRMGEFDEITGVIIDGVILKITDYFSRFLDENSVGGHVPFSDFNFRLVYGIFDKIKDLDQCCGYVLQINEGNDIWKIVEKVYVPCREGSSYSSLLKYLESEDMDEESNSVLGESEFVRLSDILSKCNIKWKN